MLALPALCFAGEAPDVDTIKVIDSPKQVVVTHSKDTVLLHVDGNAVDSGYRYECRVTPKHPHGLKVMEREGNALEFSHPFKCRDTLNTRQHFQVFGSDIYFGFGGSRIDAASRPAFSKASQLGVLNFLALGYVFNKSRSRLSLGVGFNWSWYSLKNPYFWTRSDDGVVGFEPSAEDLHDHSASLTLMSMQFPLMFNQSLGKHWNIAAGAILNWNYYARFSNCYASGSSDNSVTTHGLHQRKLSFDYIAMVSWHGLGAYFRYAPQSVFKTSFGPKIDNRWTIGLVLRGGW